MSGYIRVYRNILDWEWWSDINTYRLFTFMVLSANWKDGKFKGLDIPKGSFVSSIGKLAEKTNLTVNEVRTALKHLISTNEITSKPHGKFTVFTVNNYCLYQEDNEQITSKSREDNEELTSRSQPINDLLTTIEEEKERKEGKQENREEGKQNITVSDETVCQTDVRPVVEAWNELAAYGIKPISRLAGGSQRYQRLVARIKQYSVGEVLSAIRKIKSSDFLQGKNNKGWVITFDWFVLPNNFPKVLEGNYDGATGNSKNRFTDFPQREYGGGAMDDLERRMLSGGKTKN